MSVPRKMAMELSSLSVTIVWFVMRFFVRSEVLIARRCFGKLPRERCSFHEPLDAWYS